MDQRTFLILNGIAITLLLVFFFKRGKRPDTQPLNLGSRAKVGGRMISAVTEAQKERANHGGTRLLNVMFNYNGHSWDAFEVLGLPAGATVAQAEQSFLDHIGKSKSEEPFLRAALDAIRKASV